MQTIGKVQFNTSGVRDAVIRQVTAQGFYDQVQLMWDGWTGVRHEIMPDIKVSLGHGVLGDQGIENAWKGLCQGCVGTQEGLVYVMC